VRRCSRPLPVRRDRAPMHEERAFSECLYAPLRPERHVPNSTATMRWKSVAALTTLSRCPCCTAPIATRNRHRQLHINHIRSCADGMSQQGSRCAQQARPSMTTAAVHIGPLHQLGRSDDDVLQQATRLAVSRALVRGATSANRTVEDRREARPSSFSPRRQVRDEDDGPTTTRFEILCRKRSGVANIIVIK
jgi:hypothetical protein